MIRKDIAIREGFLHIPVKPGIGPRYSLQIWYGKSMLRDFYVSISADADAPYFFLDMTDFRDKTVTLILQEPEELPADVLERCTDGAEAAPGHPLYPDLYREELRPQFHFSSRRGWLNDPNGLVYADGKFHLYYQHNPLGTPHGSVNICWGHAVSDDLVHWEEKSDAILPWRRDWSIASGSAVIDCENRAGYGENAIIAAFTTLGTQSKDGSIFPSGGQFLAGSTDGGDHFYLFDSHATVPTENGEGWRDPRLFRYGDKIIMAVYEVEDDVNCVSFYQSEDFHHWTRTSRNKDLFECPDIFPLKTGDGEERWVLYGADGLCRIGMFDGAVFTESGQSHPLDYGTATYAGQTWSEHPEGKRVHISWVRGMGGENEGDELGYARMPFSQCMSVPCELTLVKNGEQYRVNRKPVKAMEKLRAGEAETVTAEVKDHHAFAVAPLKEYVLMLTDIKGPVTIRLGRHDVVFDPQKRMLAFENGTTAAVMSDELSVRVLADTTTMEAFFDGGIAATYAMHPQELALAVTGEAKMRVEAYTISSVWDK